MGHWVESSTRGRCEHAAKRSLRLPLMKGPLTKQPADDLLDGDRSLQVEHVEIGQQPADRGVSRARTTSRSCLRLLGVQGA